MKNKYTSNQLIHFVGHKAPDDHEKNFEVLCKVLRDGCVTHYPHDAGSIKISRTINWDLSLETEELVVPAITCFADIPLESIAIHVEKYGKFGIALPRTLLIKYGARPVSYVPTRSDDHLSTWGTTFLRDIEAVIKGFKKHFIDNQTPTKVKSRTIGKIPESQEAEINALESVILGEFLAFIKPFNSQLPPDDPNNFYMEREWRKYGNMPFKPEQVSTVIVAKGYADRVLKKNFDFSDRIYEI